MEIFSFSFQPIDSRMYVIIEDSSTIIIDPCICEEADNLLVSKHIKDVRIILTHEHYDHISGVNHFVNQYSCPVLCSLICSRNIEDPKKNISKYYDVLLRLNGKENILPTMPYSCKATNTFTHEMTFLWKKHQFYLVETPGHSEGSICIVIDKKHIFTGDSLIKGRETITKIKGGSKEKYNNMTWPYLGKLDKNMYVYPGHGEAGRLYEFL